MARAAILAALVAAVVVAAASAALTPSDCSSSTTPVIGSCIKSSVGAGNKNQFKFTIAPGDIDPTKKLQIYFWNVDQSTSGWNDNPSTYVKLQTPASDRSSNAPATISFSLLNGVTTGSSPTTVQFMLSKELSTGSNNLCAGEYKIRVDRTGKSNSMAFALYIRWADVDPAKMWAGAGETVTFTNAILPGDANSVYIKGDFNTIGYTVKNLGAQIAPNTDAGKANIWGWSLTGTNNLNTVTLVKDETSLPTLKVSSYNNVRPNSPGDAKFTFTAPTFTTANFASGYNWASNGPFLDVTFTMNTVEEWPTYASTSGTLDYTNDSTDTKDNQVIMMLKPGPMWWKLQIPTSVTDVIATPNVANAPLDIKWAWSNALTGNPETASSYANSYRTTAPKGIYNSDFYNPAGTPPTVSTKWLGAGMEQTPKIMFLYFTKSSCDGTQKLDYSITYQAPVAVPGECNSYVDCNPTEGDHPGDARKDYSANSDLKRFSRCVVQQTFNDPTDTVFGFGPGSTCVECTSDCDCNEGQYCYTGDTGICSGSNRNWICDSWGYNRRNLCVKKSTDVLGSTCRTDKAAALATATSLWTSSTPPTGNLPVMAESGQSITIGGDDDMSTNDDITGYGFCGEVRYYNSTPDANPSWNLKSASMVRKVLWEGRCFNKKCYECNPTATMGGSVAGYSDCTNDRSCVNGAIVDNMVTDFTIRTYTKNTIAGTMLAAVMMIILLNCCTLIHICCTCRIGVKKDE